MVSQVVMTQLQTLQAQIGRREDEIERLGHLLEGGRPLSSVIADSESHNDGRRLAQLDNQVEFLQQSNKVWPSSGINQGIFISTVPGDWV